MSNYSGVYLKRPGRATSPAAIVSVVVAKTHDRELDSLPGVATATLGEAYVTAARRGPAGWHRRERFRFLDAHEFWLWLERWCRKGRRTHVVSPTASDTLTLLGFWDRVDREGGHWRPPAPRQGETSPALPHAAGFRFARLILKGTPDIIDYRHDGRSFCWLSCYNYFPRDSLNLPAHDPTVPPQPKWGPGVPGKRPLDSWEQESDGWLSVFAALSDWWQGLDAGGWRPTAGGMAEGFMRSRMPQKSLATHTDTRLQRLERLAAHRGRVSNWYFGAIDNEEYTNFKANNIPTSAFGRLDGPIYHVDVASMYPWLLSQIQVPTKRLRYKDDATVGYAKNLASSCTCTAAVRLDTPHAEYPHRRGDDIDYPTGQFTAYLSGLELKRALDDGVVTHVHEIGVYQPGRPFKRAADELLEMRSAAKRSDDRSWEMFVKLLANAMTGKLAQRRARWVERPFAIAEKRWGEWWRVSATTGLRRRYRAIAGLVWEQVREEGGTGTLTACYGHLTAACSIYMRGVREKCPPLSVLSQDTDGLWITKSGLDSLLASGVQFGGEPGKLRVTLATDWARFWSAKHYVTAGGWKLSGLCRPVPVGDGLCFLDTTSANTIRQTPLGPPSAVADARRAVTLNILPVAGTIGPDGWLTPRHVGTTGPAAPSPGEQ